MWDELERAADPRLAGWIHHLRVSGTGTRLAAAAGMATDQLVTEALAVAALLPADGIALPRLAERATGDPHALDRGRPLRTLVLLAVLHLTGEPMQIPPSLVPSGLYSRPLGSISTACPPMCSSWGCVLMAPAMSIDCSTKRPTPASRCG